MKHRTAIAALALALLLVPGLSLATSAREPLERLPRLGPIVYVTAHPDDESAAIITYLARGLHARVVILSLTRGEGGQNQVGPELGEDLARVRTQELERAAAGYGAEVRFVGAEDFGYSKSLEETLKRWDEQKILGELVRQIRTLRPLAVISHWSGTERDGGGAHHRAAGVLARRAFAAADDAKAFPEQIEHGLLPWQPRYFLVRSYSTEQAGAIEVPVREPSPVLGKTYEQLGWESFQNHRSQGIHLVELPPGRRYWLRPVETRPEGVRPLVSVAELVPDLATLPDLFPTVEFLAGWRERLAGVVSLAEEARRHAVENKASDAGLALVQGAGLLAALRREIPAADADPEAGAVQAWLDTRQNEFLEAVAALAGVELEAVTDRATLTPGERAWVRLAVKAGRPEVFAALGFEFSALRLETPPDWPVEPGAAETTASQQRAEFVVMIPEKLDPNRAQAMPLRARALLRTGTLQLELAAPVQGLGQTSLGEPLLTPVSVAPPVTLELEPPLRLLPAAAGETTRDWCVRLEAHRPSLGKLGVWLDVPIGWYTPLPQEVDLEAAGARGRACFPLSLPGRVPPGRYELKAAAGRGIEVFNLGRRQRYTGSSDAGTVFEPARAQVHIVDVSVPAGLRVGYIGFNDDPVPALLAQLGVGVDMLDERVLPMARLGDYDAIVIATRAYDYREDLAAQSPRLLDYVKAGGSLVVEHQGEEWNPGYFAPYPAAKPAHRRQQRILAPTHPLLKFPNQVVADDQVFRVTDETAAMRMLVPEHPVFNFPNKIGEQDWNGWEQERGLYFWESWPEPYTPLVELADPGEEPQRGALLAAHYGDGMYIYCGLALFRQVRAGVPGGVRLYLNLLSQRRAPAETK